MQCHENINTSCQWNIWADDNIRAVLEHIFLKTDLEEGEFINFILTAPSSGFWTAALQCSDAPQVLKAECVKGGRVRGFNHERCRLDLFEAYSKPKPPQAGAENLSFNNKIRRLSPLSDPDDRRVWFNNGSSPSNSPFNRTESVSLRRSSPPKMQQQRL